MILECGQVLVPFRGLRNLGVINSTRSSIPYSVNIIHSSKLDKAPPVLHHSKDGKNYSSTTTTVCFEV